MNYFERLLEGCIFEIISHTTPADAVRSTILSRGFRFPAESDEIWGRFLPADYQEIIDKSEFPPVCNTKKELFFSLCNSPILLDGGKLSFLLDKHTGKKCFMIAPRELTISLGDNSYFWQWKRRPDSRFVNYESDTETEKQANTVKLSSGNIPKMRGDGWMEVELGYFDSKKGDDGPVEARLLEIKRLHYKGGLIVEGIQFCPKIIEYTSSEVDMAYLEF
ncbi:F-box protein PP2-B3-like [Lycium ferocissimum]|uniref:F-box protein PP2-B3-like n=1 Tax=Lycium ferocissimum TaxID=112874 RepID=UPI0028166430|nr:F-box protein PP2-B3-like [Lycium ferocissimum]